MLVNVTHCHAKTFTITGTLTFRECGNIQRNSTEITKPIVITATCSKPQSVDASWFETHNTAHIGYAVTVSLHNPILSVSCNYAVLGATENRDKLNKYLSGAPIDKIQPFRGFNMK